jgi:hypothetical protein
MRPCRQHRPRWYNDVANDISTVDFRDGGAHATDNFYPVPGAGFMEEGQPSGRSQLEGNCCFVAGSEVGASCTPQWSRGSRNLRYCLDTPTPYRPGARM